jgi:hypothetical protein
MSHALERAEHYRDLARRYLRLAASTENPNHYLRIAVQYNTLAEAEELSTSPGEGGWHFDRFDLTDGVLAPPTAEGPSVFASPQTPRAYGPLYFLSTATTPRNRFSALTSFSLIGLLADGRPLLRRWLKRLAA